MNSYYLTDSGLVRHHNEDSVLVCENLNGDNLMVVADGMGGHRAGDVASSMAVSMLGKSWVKTSGFANKKEAFMWLKNAFTMINQSILNYAKENVNCLGMGTTLTVALVFKDYTLIGHVGDSRCYIVKDNNLIQITTDHTLVNHLYKRGDISEEEAIHHPKRNVLMKAVGTNETIEVDFFDINNNYTEIMICSDGLTNMINNHIICDMLTHHNTLDFKVHRLLKTAKENGGYDNISIALLEFRGCKNA